MSLVAKKEIYLLDTNTFLTPYLNYYPIDLFPGFWDSLADKIQEGLIVILDEVKNEIVKSSRSKEDLLSQWIKNQTVANKNVIKHTTPEIVTKYQEIIEILGTDPRYNHFKAVKKWSEVADPWIVAASAVYGYTIVTFEKYVDLVPSNPCSKPKIPNLAQEFNVRVIDLFKMIRELNLFKPN